MQAIVKVANISHGLYAAELEGQGRFVVFELFDSFEPMLGDQIAHPDLCAEGNATFSNLTQGCEFDVFVQAVCEPSLVNQLCHL